MNHYSAHDSDLRWFWREFPMFVDGAKRIVRRLNKRARRREKADPYGY